MGKRKDNQQRSLPGTLKAEGTAHIEPALPPLQPLRPRRMPGKDFIASSLHLAQILVPKQPHSSLHVRCR